jgi:hypothetical protein
MQLAEILLEIPSLLKHAYILSDDFLEFGFIHPVDMHLNKIILYTVYKKT